MALSICQNWPARAVSSKTECSNLKGNFYLSPWNFFKIARTIFGVIVFLEFTTPFLENEAIDLQTGRPVLTNEKHSKTESNGSREGHLFHKKNWSCSH